MSLTKRIKKSHLRALVNTKPILVSFENSGLDQLDSRFRGNDGVGKIKQDQYKLKCNDH